MGVAILAIVWAPWAIAFLTRGGAGLIQSVVVEDYGGSPNLLGLYHGVPLTARTTQYSGVLPDRIAIYRLPILARCRTHEDVVRQVRITVVHEVAHHFGIDDDRLQELGWA